jgi:hypothetical protein
MVLGGKNIADAWNDLDNIQKVRDSIREKTDELHILHIFLDSSARWVRNFVAPY